MEPETLGIWAMIKNYAEIDVKEFPRCKEQAEEFLFSEI
jgi:hypothetical protein